MRLGQEAIREICRLTGYAYRFQFVGSERIPERGEARFGLLAAYSRLQFSDDVQPTRLVVIEILASGHDFSLHHHGHENVGSVTHDHAVKAGRRNADDRERMTVHQDALIQNSGVAAEAALPIAETQHDYGIGVRLEI